MIPSSCLPEVGSNCLYGDTYPRLHLLVEVVDSLLDSSEFHLEIMAGITLLISVSRMTILDMIWLTMLIGNMVGNMKFFVCDN